jgi:hypothetical protein
MSLIWTYSFELAEAMVLCKYVLQPTAVSLFTASRRAAVDRIMAKPVHCGTVTSLSQDKKT